MEKPLLLIVDDEQEICEITCSFLKKKNYSVISANAAEEALVLINQKHPRLVLLDMRLGEDSGLDVLKKIKQLDATIQVIMVTALNDEQSAQEAMAQGAIAYITKPFTATFLNDLIAQKLQEGGISS
ncbi:MAG: response regulator [Candidatus Omnitrophica bacterium]|nr:response regulator [Candidatus Omnitrophota bacterium]